MEAPKKVASSFWQDARPSKQPKRGSLGGSAETVRKDGGEAEHAVTEDDLKKFVKFYVQARDEITPQLPRVPSPLWLLKEHHGYLASRPATETPILEGACHEGPVLRILERWGEKSWKVMTNVCFDSRRGIPPHVELRASASAPEANFNPAIEYKLVNLRRLWMSRAVVWDVCGLYVSGPWPRRLAHLTVHFGDDDVETYRQWVTELREWGDSSLIGLYNATSMGPGGTR